MNRSIKIIKTLFSPEFYQWESKEEFNTRITEKCVGSYNVTENVYLCEVY